MIRTAKFSLRTSPEASAIKDVCLHVAKCNIRTIKIDDGAKPGLTAFCKSPRHNKVANCNHGEAVRDIRRNRTDHIIAPHLVVPMVTFLV